MNKVVLKNFRIIDEASDFFGSLVVENGIIRTINSDADNISGEDFIIEGRNFPSSAVVMPAFFDLHAHFRDPGFPEKETLESASLAAVAGGFTTVICMANTMPVIDTIEKAREIKSRSDRLGFVDLYPVISLTKGMEGREISGIKDLPDVTDVDAVKLPLLLSEDGRDIADDDLFLAAMRQAKWLGIPVSCHCDFGETEVAAVRRVIEMGKKAGCHIHIAHVSAKESAALIRETKKKSSSDPDSGFRVTCEATPHHIGAAAEDARRMGEESFGRVNPPLQTMEDCREIITALNDGTIDAIATDHAPHTNEDKAAGAPGFTGLETAFAVCMTDLFPCLSHRDTETQRHRDEEGEMNNMETDTILSKHSPSSVPQCLRVRKMGGNLKSLQHISALMSANPARIAGLNDRGRIAAGMRADLIIADTQAVWKVEPEQFRSKGKCTPFAGRELHGKILMTLNKGNIVFGGNYIG
ncbi:MAG: amidohydrolase family protein [Treponema sp.]|nr:amidohydrolase family protein [Treponema sp.]